MSEINLKDLQNSNFPVKYNLKNPTDVNSVITKFKEFSNSMFKKYTEKEDIKIDVIFNKRLKTTAGMAIMHEGLIHLNPKILQLKSPKKYKQGVNHYRLETLRQTFLHELAHVLSYWKIGPLDYFSRKPHGPEWKEACAFLGIPNEPVCHDINFEKCL